jgi:isoleucyl-tRNA synthetase
MAIHGAVKPALEQARNAGHVGSSLQSSVEIHIAEVGEGKQHDVVLGVLERHADELASMFVVSGVRIKKHSATDPTPTPETQVKDFVFSQEFEISGVKGHVEVHAPEHAKCPRCWRYVALQEDTLCTRCEDVVKALEG